MAAETSGRGLGNPLRWDALRRSGFPTLSENSGPTAPSRRYLLEFLPHPAALFDCAAAAMLVDANTLFQDAFKGRQPILTLADFESLFESPPGLTHLLNGPETREARLRKPEQTRIVRDGRGRCFLLSYRFVRGPVVQDGLLLMTHEVTAMLEQLAPPANTSPHDRGERSLLAALTGREREVLNLIVEGKLNKTIADILGISIKTVELHRSRVMRKMGARNAAELVRLTLNAA
jgi:DNA-binding CsgD family transcriptional regulator